MKMDSSLQAMEHEMYQLQTTGTGQDMVRYPTKLTERIDYLASAVAVADYKPADQHIAVHDLLHESLSNQKADYEDFMNGAFADFLKMLKEKGVGALVMHKE